MIKRSGSDSSAMAPHANPAWVDDFVVEQRLLGVPGTRIGDALATVEAHLAETGESATDAFGPPKEYARTLAESEDSGSSGLGTVTIIAVVLGVAGLVLLPRSFEAWLEGGLVTVTIGDLVVLVVLAGLVAVLLAVPDTVMRFLIEHKMSSLLFGPILVVGFVVAMLAWRDPVAGLATTPVMLLAVLGLVVSTVLYWREPVDPVQGPWSPTAGHARLTRAVTALLLPAFAALLCLLTWLTWVTA